MEISYYGRGCFRLKGKEHNVIVDPEEDMLKKSMSKADHVVLVETGSRTSAADLKGASGVQKVSGPGEYEFHGTEVTGRRCAGATVMSVTLDEVRCVTLGRTSSPPDDAVIDSLGHVDVLFVPVGGGDVLDPRAAIGVIREIEPSVVIPMHYRTPGDRATDSYGELDTFLKEFGVEDATPMPKVNVSPTSSAEENLTATVVLQVTA